MKLKNSALLIVLLFGTTAVYGQQNFEKRTYIEINERTDFYEVNRRYEIVSDTVFYSTAGFLIDAEYDVFLSGEKEYIVITYPNFTNEKHFEKPVDKVATKMDITEIQANGVRFPIKGINAKILIIEKEKFDKLDKVTLYDTRWTLGKIGGSWLGYTGYVIPKGKNYKLTTGLLTIPFKLRPAQDSLNFKMTTDVTIGPYIGITKRLSKRNNHYVTLPATLGLSFVNLSNNTTSNQQNNDIDVIPGFTWSSGLIFSFDKFTIGYVLGQDYASGIGKDWVYQGKLWHSFAIGYSFLNPEKK